LAERLYDRRRPSGKLARHTSGVRTLVATVVALAVVAAAAAQAAPRPIMRVTRVTPLTVAGVGFPTSTVVRLTASAYPARQVRVVRTSAAGRFVVVFTFRARLCARMLVVARRADKGTILAKVTTPSKCP
jgi:hypothetical protein